MSTIHIDPATEGCPECGSVTHAADCPLVARRSAEDPSSRTCQECGREYVSPDALARHLQNQDEIREAMGADYLGHRAGGSGVVKVPDELEGKWS